MKRVDEEGADALVQIREPVNKFRDFVRYAVQRLKSLCPSLGKAKIAELLCRAGLHLGTTTVGRVLKETPRPVPPETAESIERVVTAKYANHVWHVDLTAAPTRAGFWAPWVPFSLPQRWPFCWWLGVLVQHASPTRSARGQHARRSLLPPATSQPTAANRALCTLAAPLPLCRTTHANRRTARRSLYARGPFPRWPAAPADHLAETRSVAFHKHIWLAGSLI